MNRRPSDSSTHADDVIYRGTIAHRLTDAAHLHREDRRAFERNNYGVYRRLRLIPCMPPTRWQVQPRVGRRVVQSLGFLGNNIGVLDLYSGYDAPNRISSSRSSYTFTKTSNAGANRMSAQSTNSAD